LRTFQKGADGVMVLGCHIGDCHYGSGNHRTAKRMPLYHKLLEFAGIDPARFHVEWVSASEGAIFQERVTEFTEKMRQLPPIKEALGRKGFRLIEVITPCSTLYARRNKLGTGLNLMQYYHDNAEIRHGADTREVGIDFQGRIVCGKFIDDERPTWFERKDEQLGRTLGDKYVPMPPEGGWLHE